MVRARYCTTASEKPLTVSRSCSCLIGTATCSPLPPLVFRKDGRPSSVKYAHQASCLLHVLPRNAFARVEVEDHPIGTLDPVFRCVPAVILDDVHLRAADQTFGLGDHRHCRVARIEIRVEPFDAGDTAFVQVLQEEQPVRDAVRCAQQRYRASLHPPPCLLARIALPDIGLGLPAYDVRDVAMILGGAKVLCAAVAGVGARMPAPAIWRVLAPDDDRAEHFIKPLAVMNVGPGHDDRQRDATAVHQQVTCMIGETTCTVSPFMIGAQAFGLRRSSVFGRMPICCIMPSESHQC